MKPRFLMSNRRKNSVRNKVIGKKWMYLEKKTLHRQNVGLSKMVRVALKNCMVSFYGLGNFIG